MNNLLKMNNYQLLRNRIYLGGCIGIFLLGFLTARTYDTDVLGASGGIAASLSDIFIGMVYDSTVLHIIVSSLLAPVSYTHLLLAAAFIPAPYGLAAPPDLQAFLLFLLTLFLGLFNVAAFCMLISVSYTHLDVYKRQDRGLGKDVPYVL